MSRSSRAAIALSAGIAACAKFGAGEAPADPDAGNTPLADGGASEAGIKGASIDGGTNDAAIDSSAFDAYNDWVPCDVPPFVEPFDGDWNHSIWTEAKDDANPTFAPFEVLNGALQVTYPARATKGQHVLIMFPKPTTFATCAQTMVQFTLTAAPDSAQLISYFFGDDHVIFFVLDTKSGAPNLQLVEQLFNHGYERRLTAAPGLAVSLGTPHLLVFRFRAGSSSTLPAYQAWLDGKAFELDQSMLQGADNIQQVYIGAPYAPPTAQATYSVDEFRIQ